MMNLSFVIIILSFTNLLLIVSARDIDNNQLNQDNHQNSNQPNFEINQENGKKRSQDEETKQEKTKSEHQFKEEDNDQLDKRLNEDKKTAKDVSIDDYVYIKIKTVDLKNTDNLDVKEVKELIDEFALANDEIDDHLTNKIKETTEHDTPIKKTLEKIYEYDKEQKLKDLDKNPKNEVSKDNLKEKEIMVSTVYPKIDFVKVKFKKNENAKKIEEEEEEIPEELTKEQLLGKQYFEDALTKLDTNRNAAYKLLEQAASLGYTPAENYLLQGLVFGDFNFGVQFMKNQLDYYARKGNALAQMFYGFFYASGIFYKPSQANALLYYTVSSAANNTYAQMALGYRYWYGINVKQNCAKALKYYRKVAKQVEKTISTIPGQLIERKRLFDESENPSSYSVLNPDMIQYYQVLAENGDTLAQIAVGQIHYQGMRGVPKDHRKALKFLKMAASNKNSNAMAYLGKMYLEGSDVIEQNFDLAREYFELAKEKNSAAGYCGLGTMYLYGKGVEKDYAKAFSYFNKAAEQGLVEAQYQIGIMYYNGYGVAQNYQEAFKYFYLASQAGFVLGFYYLAIMHAEGLGTQRSCPSAVELFKNVAERGPWSKILMDAFTDYKEGNVLNSYIKYSFLAELGYEVAQSNAASLLDNNELNKYYSSNESYTRAFMYWTRSAMQGYSVARVKIGDYYYYGQGINSDYELAAAQYRLASDRSAQALFNLGYMHEHGLGLRKDFHLAKRFYDQAADTSHDANIPVLLAKTKLYTVHFFEKFTELSFEKIVLDTIDKIMFDDWDLYLLAALVVILGCIIRRNRG